MGECVSEYVATEIELSSYYRSTLYKEVYSVQLLVQLARSIPKQRPWKRLTYLMQLQNIEKTNSVLVHKHRMVTVANMLSHVRHPFPRIKIDSQLDERDYKFEMEGASQLFLRKFGKNWWQIFPGCIYLCHDDIQRFLVGVGRSTYWCVLLFVAYKV